MSGQPAYNRLKVTRHSEAHAPWPTPRHRVTFVIERRERDGLRETRQVTFSQAEVVKALRKAGFVVFPPEEMK